MNRETIFSGDRVYRYTLWRKVPPIFDFQDHCKWPGHYVQFIGLNPSAADEVKDDPTIRKCRYFAARFGFTAMCMTNLFAYRATDPVAMMDYPWPRGPDNDSYLIEIAKEAGLVIAAWGIHGTHTNRDKEIRAAIQNLHCLGVTKGGHPRHPLYLKNTARPIPLVSAIPASV